MTINWPFPSLWMFILVASSRIWIARPLPNTNPAKPGSGVFGTSSTEAKLKAPATSPTVSTDEDEPPSPPQVFEDASASLMDSAFSPSWTLEDPRWMDAVNLLPPTDPDDVPGTSQEGMFVMRFSLGILSPDSSILKRFGSHTIKTFTQSNIL